jgi:hypothetical protein
LVGMTPMSRSAPTALSRYCIGVFTTISVIGLPSLEEMPGRIIGTRRMIGAVTITAPFCSRQQRRLAHAGLAPKSESGAAALDAVDAA